MIYIEPINVKWRPLLAYNIPRHERVAFEYYLMYEYVKRVNRFVDLRLWESRFPPLSPQWLSIKEENDWFLGPWKATGDLLSHLRIKNGTTIGFDKRIKFDKKGHTYLDLARWLEYGTTTESGGVRIPPRPLFRDTYLYMRKNIGRYYKRWKAGVVDENIRLRSSVDKQN